MYQVFYGYDAGESIQAYLVYCGLDDRVVEALLSPENRKQVASQAGFCFMQVLKDGYLIVATT
jgi:hypothetical protein